MKKRIAWAIAAAALFCLLGAFYSWTKFVEKHHENTVSAGRAEMERLAITHPDKGEVVRQLGKPWLEASTVEAIEHENLFAQTDSPHKARKYPRALIYHKGDLVYFVYLDAQGKMADFWVARN